MLLTHLKLSIRHIVKQRLFSLINIVGLAVGLASCVAILLFVRDEMSYDSFWPEGEQIHHVTWRSTPDGRGELYLGATPGPIGPLLASDFGADMDAVTRVTNSSEAVIRDGQGLPVMAYFVDANFFEVFQPSFIAGDRATALKDVSGLVITESAAQKFFGESDVLGREVHFGSGRSFIVSGVVEDLPDNTQFSYEMIVPLLDTDFIEDGHVLTESWDSIGFMTFVKLKAGVPATRFDSLFGSFLDRYAPDWGVDFVASERWKMELVPIADMHMYGPARAVYKPKGDINTVYAFVAIALLILVIACLNFMNLATARSAARAREVAVRKVLGAGRADIIRQFLIETAVMVGLSVVLALAILEVALPYLNEVLAKVLRLDYAGDPLSLAALAGLALITVIGAGLHPALATSRYLPARVLRAGRSEPAGSVRLRMVLVVIQFAISIFLITATTIVYRQLNHMQSLDRGFDAENILWVSKMSDDAVAPMQEAFKKRLLDHPDVMNAAFSWTLPGYSGRSYNGVSGVDGKEVAPMAITTRYVDEDYFTTYGTEVTNGRSFSKAYGTDAMRQKGEADWHDGAGLVNRAALDYLGLGTAAEAVGKTVQLDTITITVIGVVEDTLVDHVASGSEPMLYVNDPGSYARLGVRYRSSDAAFKDVAEGIWREMFPLVPPRMGFLDETLEAQFAADRERGFIFAVFSGLAILISLLGLYGLASFSTAQRAKEISVRKVLGARVRDIVSLLVWQFSKPVLFASLIAWPFAVYFMQNWLTRFPSQVGFDVLTFLTPSIGALVLAWLAVGGHAAFVASSNPIAALKEE
ncbi:ABC transporter permease [Kordiimonas sp.]|uniref:ABC transporter permease n=1 Tax=Kordiimonas sp. TaxID=1970157 RepID=UPI003A950F73